MCLIELTNASFAYEKEEQPVLKDLNLKVESGQCLVIEGDNGSGKSTLFRILNGLSFLQNGNYFFDGTEITENYLKNNRNAKLFHKRIGYLFQNPDVMLFNARVYDEIAFGPRQLGIEESEVDKRVKDCMRLFEIENLADKAPYHLSGGQKKKVALASILSLNPDVIILDEPFAGLDRKSQDNLLNLMQDLKQAQKTLIIATHNPEVTSKLSDRVFSL